MTPDWESNESAMEFQAGGVSLVLKGPSHADNVVEDEFEPYIWRIDGSQRQLVRTFATSYDTLNDNQKAAITLTLDDGQGPSYTLYVGSTQVQKGLRGIERSLQDLRREH